MLWNILNLILEDWNREAQPFQSKIDASQDENEELYYIVRVFKELPPHYFKCLFSYVMFFIALNNAYDKLYTELNKLNRKPFLQIRHDKKPKFNKYLKKVKEVRNIAIAHIGSNKVRDIDSRAAMMWLPLALGKPIGESFDINDLTFNPRKLVTRNSDNQMIEESMSLEIGGIPELHQHCMEYLQEYDEVCVDYLKSIIEKLPRETENGRYYPFSS